MVVQEVTCGSAGLGRSVLSGPRGGPLMLSAGFRGRSRTGAGNKKGRERGPGQDRLVARRVSS